MADDEKRAFLSWLDKEIATDKGLVIQMTNIHAPQVLIDKYQAEIAAATLIANKLRSYETFTV